jgi:hypothetical protein
VNGGTENADFGLFCESTFRLENSVVNPSGRTEGRNRRNVDKAEVKVSRHALLE